MNDGIFKIQPGAGKATVKPRINVGGWYRDKETDYLYQVFGLARHSVIGEWLVVYVHHSNEYLIAVPVKIWQERMEFEEEQDGR